MKNPASAGFLVCDAGFAAAAELEAFFGECKEREDLGLLRRLFLGRAVGDELRKFRHLRGPAAVLLLLVDDREVHQRLPYLAGAAPPWPAIDSFQITASSTA